MPNALVRYRCAALFALALGAACSSDTVGVDDPNEKTDAELKVVRSSATAPPLAMVTTSFYAKRGSEHEIKLYYRPRAGSVDSTEFLRFVVRPNSLLRRPDGTAFAVGDSILITIRVPDPRRFAVEFLPSGLLFNPNAQAELKMSFEEAEGDVDGDGDSDDSDRSLERQLSIWFQEASGQPWRRLSSVVVEDNDEIEAKLNGFTTYAVAY